MYLPNGGIGKGNKKFLWERFNFSDHLLIIGAKIITTGVLFRNADKTETGSMMRGNQKNHSPLFRGQVGLCQPFSTPDWRTAFANQKKYANGYHSFVGKTSK
jgi:hypothetical protein